MATPSMNDVLNSEGYTPAVWEDHTLNLLVAIGVGCTTSATHAGQRCVVDSSVVAVSFLPFADIEFRANLYRAPEFIILSSMNDYTIITALRDGVMVAS